MEDVEEDGEETIAETKYDFTEDVDALVAGEEPQKNSDSVQQQSLKQQ